MVNCDVYEAPDANNFWSWKKIFSGVITGASLVYKAGTTTNRAVRFECLHSACYLHAVPLGITRYMIGSFVIRALLQIEAQPEQMYGWMHSREINITTLCEKLAEKICGNADIVTRISYLVDGIVALSGAQENVEIDPNKLDIMKVREHIECAYTVNKQLYEHYVSGAAPASDQTAVTHSNAGKAMTLDDRFNQYLGELLLERLQGTSVLEAIVSIITADQYMLNLVPSLTGKLKLEPSNAWASKPERILTFKDLKAFNSTVNPLAHVADPDVFIVNFSEALPMYGLNSMTGQPTALVGVYSRNKKFVEDWDKVKNNTKENSFDNEYALVNFKQRVIKAPSWMTDAFIGSDVATDTPKAQQSEQQAYPQTTGDVNQKTKEERTEDAPKYNVMNTEALANKVAKALFGFMHGRSNTAEVELLPSLRFGSDDPDNKPLEELVGRIIDIVPGELDDKLQPLPDALISVRGMVTQLAFSYDTGSSSSCSLTMQLSRVRPVSDEEAIECPLYALVKETK